MGWFRKKEAQPRRRTASAELRQPAAPPERNPFQRNRTLTGSMSSHVTSVNEQNADLKSSRVQTHELTRKRRHIGLLFVLVIGVSLVLYALVMQFTAEVKIKVAGAPNVPVQADYEEAIQSYLMGHPAERLRFLLNNDQLTRYLQAKTPEIAAVKVQGWAGFGTSDFLLTARQPIAGWTIQGKQQFVDSNGIAFTRNYYPMPTVQIVDNSGAQAQTGQAIASNRFLGFVGRVVGLAGARGLTVSQVAIPAGTTRQIEIKLQGADYPIKLTIDRPAGEQVEDMARAVAWFKAQNRTAQYIDVRVGGKAFYR